MLSLFFSQTHTQPEGLLGSAPWAEAYHKYSFVPSDHLKTFLFLNFAHTWLQLAERYSKWLFMIFELQHPDRL